MMCKPKISILISVLDCSGQQLQTIHAADILGPEPILCQADVEGNILISDLFTNRLLIAHADQPSSQWRVVNMTGLPDGDGCSGALWFRHILYVASGRHLLTFERASLT